MQNILLEQLLLEKAEHTSSLDSKVSQNKFNHFMQYVKNKQVVRFYYVGDQEDGQKAGKKKKAAGLPYNEAGWRTVEIVCFGNGFIPTKKNSKRKGQKLNNKDYIRAYQRDGPSVSNKKTGKAHRPMPGWRFFRLDRITTYVVKNENFVQPAQSNFNPDGDKNLAVHYAISKFNPGQSDTPATLVNPPAGPKPVTPEQPKQGKPTKPEAEPTDQNPLPDKETEKEPEQPKPTTHYATTRTPKPVVTMRNGKPHYKVRNGKPVIKMREGLIDLLMQVIMEENN